MPITASRTGRAARALAALLLAGSVLAACGGGAEKSADGRLVTGSPRNQATNVPGLYAAGEVDYQYHGANRLGANSLLSSIYGGMVAGPAIASYVKNLGVSSLDLKGAIFEKAKKRSAAQYEALLGMNGKENPYLLHGELAPPVEVGAAPEGDPPGARRPAAQGRVADPAGDRGALVDEGEDLRLGAGPVVELHGQREHQHAADRRVVGVEAAQR